MYWKKELQNSITTIEHLKNYTQLSTADADKLNQIIQTHPLKIPKYYLSLIDWNNHDDPVRKMAVPSLDEIDNTGSYDTSGELDNTKVRGLQHKYSQTALLLITNNCASFCRYCFRRRLVGQSTEEIINRFRDALNYIENHHEINNVLISGGDPFTLPTKVIEKILKGLSHIKHLSYIRIGTRITATLPHRIIEDNKLLNVLEKYSKNNRRLFIVTHFNHINEITKKSLAALDLLLKHRVIINNQTVLLKGVNDKPETIAKLQNKLVSVGVNPYYIFQCRPVKGIKNNFQVPLIEATRIIEDAKKDMSGHAKRFHFMMSHHTGKIEILGIMDENIYLKYHQAKDEKNIGIIFKKKINNTARWLEDLE